MAKITSADVGLGGFLVRFIIAQLTVFISYNPSDYSYYAWAVAPLITGTPLLDPVKVLAGVALLIVWVVFLIATLRSLRWIGALLVSGFFVTLIWLAVDWQLIPVDNFTLWVYLGEFVVGAVLGVGVSWSHIHRRITGQVDMDPVDR